jgi:hypothetical protein
MIKEVQWCLRVGLTRAQDLPKSNVLSSTDLSKYSTLDLHSRKQQKSKSIENNVNLEWNEEFVFHVNDATHDLVITCDATHDLVITLPR